MSDNKSDSKNPEYKGVNEDVYILGQRAVDSNNGGLTGFVGGAAVGALANKQVNNIIDKALSKLDISNSATIEMSKTDGGSYKANLNSRFGRFGTALIVGGVLSIVGSIVGDIVGRIRGKKKIDVARAQFDEITAENRELKSKLSGIETAAAIVNGGSQKSFVADLENQRAKQAAHGASVAG